jgi:hypothetical protein
MGGTAPEPLLALRPEPRLHAEIQALPHLLPATRPARRIARRYEIELVGAPFQRRERKGAKAEKNDF